MAGILIFTNYDVLIHKLKDGKKSQGCYCYWETSRFPKQSVDKLYFAINGIVRGYFEIFGTIQNNDTGLFEFRFYSESWTEIKDGEQLKPSQGWRYYDEN